MRRPNAIQRFFMICSGADRDVLLNCSTEWNKYTGIGATIFFTGVLAMISGGYALYAIFRGEPGAMAYAIVFGLFWGFMIFNLDRFIVSSIRKQGEWEKEAIQAIPRIILAIIISIVIAKPLEVKIFEARIAQQIQTNKLQKLEEEKLTIDKLNDVTKLENTLETQNEELKALDSLRLGDPTDDNFQLLLASREEARQELEKVRERNIPELNDIRFNMDKVRNNPDNIIEKTDSLGNVIDRDFTPRANSILKDLRGRRNSLNRAIRLKENVVEDFDARIQKGRDDYRASIAQKINSKEVELGQAKETKAKADSIAALQFDESREIKEKSYTNNFVTQLEAMGSLTSSNSTMWWTSTLIMLLFIVIETAPVAVKLLSKRGPYDEILERIEYEHFITEKEQISKWNSKINELLIKAEEAAKLEGDIFIKVEKQRLDYELKNNNKILDNLAKKQEHLAEIAIEKWYQEELEKTKNNDSQNTPSPALEGGFWKLLGATDKIEFCFRNGETDNELIYIENDELTRGKWSYQKGAVEELKIELPQTTAEYLVVALQENILKLQEKGSQDIIELEKV